MGIKSLEDCGRLLEDKNNMSYCVSNDKGSIRLAAFLHDMPCKSQPTSNWGIALAAPRLPEVTSNLTGRNMTSQIMTSADLISISMAVPFASLRLLDTGQQAELKSRGLRSWRRKSHLGSVSTFEYNFRLSFSTSKPDGSGSNAALELTAPTLAIHFQLCLSLFNLWPDWALEQGNY